MGHKLTVTIALLAAFSSASAVAANQPCSGKKGGVARCENGKFVCNDGTVSASKQVCGASKPAQTAAPASSKSSQTPPKTSPAPAKTYPMPPKAPATPSKTYPAPATGTAPSSPYR
jgi:hypothetical protein